MWNKPWRLAEGFTVGAGLLLTGMLLQLTTGAIDWSAFAWPINLILLCCYLLFIGIIYAFHVKVYFFRWLSHYTSVIPALTYAVVLTLIMGVTKQVPDGHPSNDPIGFTRMLSFWPFVLMYLWITTILGLAILKHLSSFKLKEIPFLLNHLGLFIALVSATLGSADMQRLTMTTRIGQPEWRAADAQGNLHELPLAIELESFDIDEYPPKLMMISNESGMPLPKGKPENLLLEKGFKQGKLLNWNIRVEKILPLAASIINGDTVHFVEWPSMGATCAAYIVASNQSGEIRKEGWVSCGSFLFPFNALRLNDKISVVMPEREPERFTSNVIIYTKSGKEMKADIEVNKPFNVEGWKIYQLSYDETKGKWSDISILELVSDPWLPFVYAGIGMLLLGAVCMFVTAGKQKEAES